MSKCSYSAYEKQVKRLSEVYGKQFYSAERIITLWNQEIQFWLEDKLQRAVDSFICNSRTAPLVEQFREFSASERERDWNKEKAQHHNDTIKCLDSDSERHFMKEIIRRVTGHMPDHEWEQFKRMVNCVCKNDTSTDCKICDGSGLVVRDQNGGQYAYKCSCSIGQNRPEKYPTFH